MVNYSFLRQKNIQPIALCYRGGTVSVRPPEPLMVVPLLPLVTEVEWLCPLAPEALVLKVVVPLLCETLPLTVLPFWPVTLAEPFPAV